MKKTINFSGILLRVIMPAIIAGVLINLSSCTKTETNKPAPTVTVTTATASNTAGSVITNSVHVDAPEGGKTLAILVNGAANTALADVPLSGTAQDVPISFTIPATATVGAVYVISFQAVDNKGQESIAAFFTVTVSSVPAKQIVDVTGSITTNTTWTNDKIYRLNGFVRIGTDVKPGGNNAAVVAPVISNPTTLTIQEGTVIYGKTGTPGGTLIVQRGSKIVAIGTATKPIIFTSEKAPSTKKSGDWGGVVLCGQAKQNVLVSTSTGTNIEELEGAYQGYFGGTLDNDNSGTLKYVRIEYAGYPINPNQEINGLTLGGVGSGTTLSYIQVTYANDDSFEWFGGAVNADHLIAYKGIDDDFDTDNGFTGYVQFGLAIRDASIADQSGSNGFESDNNGISTDDLPNTGAKFSNMTILGGKATVGTGINVQFQNVAQIRRYSEIDIYNSFFTGFPNGIYIDGNRPTGNLGALGSVLKANQGKVELKNNILAGVESWGGNGFGRVTTADEVANVTPPTGGAYPYSPNQEYNGATTVPPRGRAVFAGDGAFSSGVFAAVAANTEQTINGVPAIQWFKSTNSILARWQDAGLNANNFEPLNGIPTLTPTGALLAGADFTGLTVGTGSPSAGFVSVAYRGAFGTTDWTTAGGAWVNWNPQATDYSK